MNRMLKRAAFAWCGLLAAATLNPAVLHAQKSAPEAGRAVKPDAGIEAKRIVVEPDIPQPRYVADIWTDRSSYWPNDNIQVFFKVSFDAYVYIFNQDTAGETTQIFPNYYDRDNFCRANRTYVIPDRDYKLRVTGPTGYETLQIVAYPRRYAYFNPFHEFRQDDPFPLRRDGLEQLKELHRRNQQPEAARPKAGRPDAPTAQRIAVEPAHPVDPGYAEGWTRFYVRGFVRTPPPAPHPGHPPRHTGRLKITSDPDHAQVYLDGKYIGETPQFVERLEFGEYFIRVERPGYRDEERWVKIDADKTYSIRLILDRRRSR